MAGQGFHLLLQVLLSGVAAGERVQVVMLHKELTGGATVRIIILMQVFVTEQHLQAVAVQVLVTVFQVIRQQEQADRVLCFYFIILQEFAQLVRVLQVQKQIGATVSNTYN
jgi:hypothetical protein